MSIDRLRSFCSTGLFGKGDVTGHDFHGNQYGGGGGSALRERAKVALDRWNKSGKANAFEMYGSDGKAKIDAHTKKLEAAVARHAPKK